MAGLLGSGPPSKAAESDVDMKCWCRESTEHHRAEWPSLASWPPGLAWPPGLLLASWPPVLLGRARKSGVPDAVRKDVPLGQSTLFPLCR